jgi:hypothetical protein
VIFTRTSGTAKGVGQVIETQIMSSFKMTLDVASKLVEVDVIQARVLGRYYWCRREVHGMLGWIC